MFVLFLSGTSGLRTTQASVFRYTYLPPHRCSQYRSRTGKLSPLSLSSPPLSTRVSTYSLTHPPIHLSYTRLLTHPSHLYANSLTDSHHTPTHISLIHSSIYSLALTLTNSLIHHTYFTRTHPLAQHLSHSTRPPISQKNTQFLAQTLTH